MTTAELLTDLTAKGISLRESEPDKLTMDGPREALAAVDLDVLRVHKGVLLKMLRAESCAPHNNPLNYRYEPDKYGRSG